MSNDVRCWDLQRQIIGLGEYEEEGRCSRGRAPPPPPPPPRAQRAERLPH